MIDTEKLLRLMRNQRSDYITICRAADRIESLQAENRIKSEARKRERRSRAKEQGQ